MPCPGVDNLLNTSPDRPRIDIERVVHEIIGRFGLDAPRCQLPLREVPPVLVAMAWAPALIAAASTCLSSGSGSSKVSDPPQPDSYVDVSGQILAIVLTIHTANLLRGGLAGEKDRSVQGAVARRLDGDLHRAELPGVDSGRHRDGGRSRVQGSRHREIFYAGVGCDLTW
jgi:hypothetical protein